MKFLTFRFTQILLVFFLVVFLIVTTSAQQPPIEWNEVTYPSTSNLYALISSNSKLIVGTGNGIFVSTDNGQSWTASNNGLPINCTVRSLVKLNNSIFAATDKGVWKSDNGGESWVDAGSGLLMNQSVIPLIAKGDMLFLATGYTGIGGKIYRSSDFGKTWVEKIKGLPADYPTAGSLVVAGNTIFALGGGNLFLSEDNGENWSAKTLPANWSYLTNLASAGSVIYVGGAFPPQNTVSFSRPVLWRSVNKGQSWEEIATFVGFTSGGFDNIVTLGNNLVAIGTASASPSAIFTEYLYSSNAGNTFVNSGPPKQIGPFAPVFRNSFIVNNSIFVIRADSKLYRSNAFIAPVTTTVSAANYQITPLSGESIVSVFGSGMALTTAAAVGVPLPTSLENTSVTVTDKNGNTKTASLFYISPTQINFQIPAGLASGVGTATVNLYNQIVGRGVVVITNVSPGLFTVNQTGEGFAAANVQRIKTDGTNIYQPIVQYNSTTNNYAATPINVSTADQVYLNLYGTGIRGRSDLANVKATVGGVDVPVVYAGAHGSYIGVDQINVLLPSTLAGKGEVEVVLTVDAQVANAVKLSIQ